MSLVSRQYIRDLIELAAFECVDFFGKGKEGHANLPHVELRIERLVEVENKQARSESRPNAIGTNGATSILVDIEQVPYPIDTIRSRWSEIMSLPKVSKLLASFADYRLRSSIVTNPVPSGAPRDIDNYCIVTLSDAIVRIERGKEVDNWSLASAGRLLQTLSSDKQVSTIVAPLVNFYVQSKQPISFTDNVTIRPATQDEIEEFGVRKSILGHELTSLHGFVRFLPVLWVAETSFTRTPNSGAPDLQSFEEVDAIVAALNILGDQFFDYPLAAFTDQPYNHSSRGQPNPRTPAFHNWSPFEGPFVLQAPDISRAIEFVRKVVPILKGAQPKAIKIAVSRLRLASTREIDPDKVVDGVIAMEALLLLEHEPDKSFRLATRTAILVADESEERQKVFEFVSRLNVGRGDVKPLEIVKIIISRH